MGLLIPAAIELKSCVVVHRDLAGMSDRVPGLGRRGRSGEASGKLFAEQFEALANAIPRSW